MDKLERALQTAIQIKRDLENMIEQEKKMEELGLFSLEKRTLWI